MRQIRTAVMTAALGLVAAPVFAQVQGNTNGNATNGRDNCPCAHEHTNARTAGATASNATPPRHHHHHARGNAVVGVKSPTNPHPGETLSYVNARYNNDLGEGCAFDTHAQGHFLTPDRLGQDANATLHDVDLTTTSDLACNGRSMRREVQRFVFPSVSRSELQAMMHERAATPLPTAPHCGYTPMYSFETGTLSIRGVATDCPPGATTAIGGGPGGTVNTQWLRARGTMPSAWGGGPRPLPPNARPVYPTNDLSNQADPGVR